MGHALVIEKLNGLLQRLSSRKKFLQTILSYFEKYKHVIERHPALRSIADELVAVSGLLQLREFEANAEQTGKTNVEKVKMINQHVKALHDSLKDGAMIWLALKKTILSISIKLTQFFGAGAAKLEKKWTQLKIEVDKREGLASVKRRLEKGNKRIEEARQNGYGYRFMSSDIDYSQEREVVFQVSGAKIKAKMGVCYFPISPNNPIHGIVISASKAGKFSADQSQRLARSTLLSSRAQQDLLLDDDKRKPHSGPVQASWGHF